MSFSTVLFSVAIQKRNKYQIRVSLSSNTRREERKRSFTTEMQRHFFGQKIKGSSSAAKNSIVHSSCSDRTQQGSHFFPSAARGVVPLSYIRSKHRWIRRGSADSGISSGAEVAPCHNCATLSTVVPSLVSSCLVEGGDRSARPLHRKPRSRLCAGGMPFTELSSSACCVTK